MISSMRTTTRLLCLATILAFFLFGTNRKTFSQDRSAEPTPLHYHPRGMYMWDTWYLQQGDTTHLFHLQVKRPNSRRPDADEGTIGHAVSKDLIHWEELPTAVRRGPGDYDGGFLYTGCAVESAGTIFLFYCGNSYPSNMPRAREAMCLATSRNGIDFTKHPGNPIIDPDPNRYYVAKDPPAPFPHHAQKDTDCRDLAVVRDPAGNGWLGYVVMRLKGQPDAFHSACIALCRSKDLMQWEVGPPCCTPNRFNCFEVPDVFEMDGKWYMIALTGDGYGQSQRWSDPATTCGTIVFQAARPEGPFEEVRDNLLLASKKNVWQGFSARTVLCGGQRLMIYTRCEGIPGRGRLSWPVKLVPYPGGGLLPRYWEGCDRGFQSPQSLVGMTLDSNNVVERRVLGTIPTDNRTYMIRATLNLKQGQAGIGFGLEKEAGGYLAMLAPLEGPRGLVKLTTTEGTTIADRQWPLQAKRPHDLRLVVVDEMIEIYVDDVLLVDFFLPQLKAGQAALVVKGNATFENIEYRSGLVVP